MITLRPKKMGLEEFNRSVHNEVLAGNLKRVFSVMIASIVIEILMIGFFLWNRYFGTAMDVRYLYAYITLAGLLIAALPVAYKYKNKETLIKKETFWLNRVLDCFAIFIMVWGSYIAVLDHDANGSAIAYIVVVVCLSIFVNLNWLRTFILMLPSLATYIFGIMSSETHVNHAMSEIVNLVILFLFLTVLNGVTYHTAFSNISNRLRLDEANRMLAASSLTDDLTQMYNRRAMRNYISDNFIKADKKPKSIGILLMDVDYFKEYNDDFGHDIGDMALEALGKLLNSYNSKNALSARYGGDEFIIIYKNVLANQIYQDAETIRKRVETQLFGSGHTHPIPLFSVSIGAFFEDDIDMLDFSAYIKMVDKALYAAKNSGRNRIAYDENLREA